MNYLPDFDNRLTDEEREAELMIIEIAARIQLSPTQVKTAEQNYEALADYIDAPGSQLEDSIRNVHPSGSFSIQAPIVGQFKDCLLYTSPSPRDGLLSRMPSSA